MAKHNAASQGDGGTTSRSLQVQHYAEMQQHKARHNAALDFAWTGTQVPSRHLLASHDAGQQSI